LAKENINIEMIASTALALTCVVDSKRSDEAARVLHNAFIGEEAV
jgi:aspartate kinase